MKRICVVTGTRAEYGPLFWVLKEIDAHPDLELQLVVTGMHLSPEYGSTWKTIETDGFAITAKVEMLLSGDTGAAIAKSMGLGTIGFADTFDRLKPDIVVVWGDRFELMAAAQAAMVARIPIAHIGGGDVTEGAFDDSIRHAITKMAHLHFPIIADSARRLRQLGEDPARIHLAGNASLDHLRRTVFLDRSEVEARLGFSLRPRNVLVTYHPVTLDPQEGHRGWTEMLAALDSLGDGVGIVMTAPNADNDSRELMAELETFAAAHPNAVLRDSLGSQLYMSTARLCDAVVGNSSSGLLEIPSLEVATVNIGTRQKGRPRAASVIDCPPERDAIRVAMDRAMAMDCSLVVNPYGDGHSARRIVHVLAGIEDFPALLHKSFVDLAENGEAGVTP